MLFLTPSLLQMLLASRWLSVGSLRDPGSFHVVALLTPKAREASVGSSAFSWQWRKRLRAILWARPGSGAPHVHLLARTQSHAQPVKKPGDIGHHVPMNKMTWVSEHSAAEYVGTSLPRKQVPWESGTVVYLSHIPEPGPVSRVGKVLGTHMD